MADKKAETSSQEPSTKPVIDLLTSILDDLRRQGQSNTTTNTPPPLSNKAVIAQAAFKEISEALDV